MILKLSNDRVKFNIIYKTSFWANRAKESYSLSGEGSSIEATQSIRKNLPVFIKDTNIQSMLDIPCGDLFWINQLDLNLKKYIGADIVKSIINDNMKKNKKNNFSFIQLNIINDKLPESDLLFSRDCLVHLTINQIKQTLINISKNNFQYFATTHFNDCEVNEDSKLGDRWKKINLTKKPFYLKNPDYLLEDSSVHDPQKYIAIWKKKNFIYNISL